MGSLFGLLPRRCTSLLLFPFLLWGEVCDVEALVEFSVQLKPRAKLPFKCEYFVFGLLTLDLIIKGTIPSTVCTKLNGTGSSLLESVVVR